MRAASATECGQPRSAPLWLNSQRSAVYGAAADSSATEPSVMSRTAPSSAPERVTRHTSAKDGSSQTGPARR